MSWKPVHSDILDPQPLIRGFVVGDIAAVPYGNQLMILFNGEQVKLCRTEQSARKYVKQLQKKLLSNNQQSGII